MIKQQNETSLNVGEFTFKPVFKYTVFNVYAIASHEYFKTMYLNLRYKTLLPLKIKNLKKTKNLFIKLKKKIPQHNLNLENMHEWENTYQFAKYILLEEQHINLNGLGIYEDYYFNKVVTKRFKPVSDANINETIKFLSARIDFYIKEKNKNRKRFTSKVTNYDLNLLQEGIYTPNIKEFIYFHLIKIKKTSLSNRENFYINSLKDSGLYSQFDLKRNLEQLKKDYSFKGLYRKHLDTFENNFLNREI